MKAIEIITAERDYQLTWEKWHAERGNVETAALHRGTAAGLKRALAILTAVEAQQCATCQEVERVELQQATH
jgi:hypothetical protein